MASPISTAMRVITSIGGVTVTPQNLMKTVWDIAAAAEKSGKFPGASKSDLFRGFWEDYKHLKEETGKTLGEYLDIYLELVPFDLLPVLYYYEYRSDPAIRQRLPRGTDSGQWFITNNCFDSSPDGPNKLWLGRPGWEPGWTACGDGDEMLETWAGYVNRVRPLIKPIGWNDERNRFVWLE